MPDGRTADKGLEIHRFLGRLLLMVGLLPDAGAYLIPNISIALQSKFRDYTSYNSYFY